MNDIQIGDVLEYTNLGKTGEPLEYHNEWIMLVTDLFMQDLKVEITWFSLESRYSRYSFFKEKRLIADIDHHSNITSRNRKAVNP